MEEVRTRRSRQRELVLAIVRSTMDHPTADWVYRQARRRLPRISLGTVYRNLKQLDRGRAHPRDPRGRRRAPASTATWAATTTSAAWAAAG